jgi:hypothetical protein
MEIFGSGAASGTGYTAVSVSWSSMGIASAVTGCIGGAVELLNRTLILQSAVIAAISGIVSQSGEKHDEAGLDNNMVSKVCWRNVYWRAKRFLLFDVKENGNDVMFDVTRARGQRLVTIFDVAQTYPSTNVETK